MSGEGFTFDLSEEVDKFLGKSSLHVEQTQPRFVLLLGGVCTGKTSMRKATYSKDYVVLDAGEIFLNLSRGEYYEFGEMFEQPLDMIGYGVAYKAIRGRRNIVTELIGSDYGPTKSVIDAMQSLGYKVEVIGVDCDLEVAMARNLNRGLDNISAHFTDPYHIRWLLQAAAENVS
ncbi:MAG TPA: zeta toxin family protein [Steroidobacteraceae bacterium]|nr:zeta toxin family protein [Steroidobacteraceae bacterium]